jgi:hypothetical protein
MAKMNESELRAITDAEMRQAVGYWSGKLANQRQQAMYYYLGEAVGDLSPPEVEGRSTVVSPDVRNTIESMLPQLMVKFAGGECPVAFLPNKPGDEQKAEQATDYIGHLYSVKNNGDAITYAWMKDALLSKNGIVKVWWDTRTEDKREEYNGLSDVELSQVMDDEEVEVIEQKSYPDEEDAEKRQGAIAQLNQQLMQAQQAGNVQAAQQIIGQLEHINSQPPVMLFDIVCKRSLNMQGRVRVENVPPEEFLISRKAKTIADAPFVGHRVPRTISELKSMGYKNTDQISSDDGGSMSMNMERIQRLGWDDEMAALNVDSANNLDDSQRIVWVTECYIKCDYDGDGIAELRRVVRAGNQILDNEIVDCAPFVSITPVPMPHKFFGLSIADLSMVTQKVNTGLLRGVLDNTWLQINGRYFAVDGQVNLDDLLTSRPGGVVRVKQPGAVGRLDQAAGNSELGMSMLEYMKGFNEDSTGWTRYNQGSDGDSLNQTATGVNQITNRADMRLDLIARNFAEGFRELFRLMLKLCAQYTQKEQITKLRGEWVPCNPRDWRNGFETNVNVGLGTGSKDQLVGHLMALTQQQQFGLQIGTADPRNVYELQKEMTKAMGFKSPDKFFSDPSKAPPRPPQPNPDEIKAQSAMQLKQVELQADAQKFQAETQLRMQEIQLQSQAKLAEQQAALQLQAENDRRDGEREQMKAALDAQLKAQDAEFQRWKAQLDAETRILVAQIGAASNEQETPIEQAAEVSEEPDTNAVIAQALQGLTEALAGLRAPRTIVRGPDGRAQGII